MLYSRRPSYASKSCSSSPSRYSRSLSRSGSRSSSRSRSRESSDVHNPGNSLYVTGLSCRTTRSQIHKHFSTEGKVVDVHLVVDPRTRESRGFAFVTMSCVRDADRCLKYLDRTVLDGRVITVEKSKRSRGRTPTPGRYMGIRPRGRHDSRSYSPYYSRERSYSYSPYYSRDRSPYDRRRSYSPCYRGRYRSRSPSDYRSPSPIRWRRSYSRDDRSPSPIRRRRSYSRGSSYSSYDHSPSPYYRGRYDRSVSRSYSPPRYRRRRSYSRSLSPERRRMSYSPERRRTRMSYSPERSKTRTRRRGRDVSSSPSRSSRNSRESYSHSRSVSSRSKSTARSS